MIDYSVLSRSDEDVDASPRDRDHILGERPIAIRYLAHLREAGVFEKMDLITGVRRSIPPFDPNAVPARLKNAEGSIPIGVHVSLSRLASARMAVAADARDLGEFARSYETLLALRRLCMSQGTPLQHVVGQMIAGIADYVVINAIPIVPNSVWIDRISEVRRRQQFQEATDQRWEYSKLSTLDMLSEAFSSASDVRWGRYSPSQIRESRPELLSRPLGTYAQNVAATERMIETFKAYQRSSPRRWPADAHPAPYWLVRWIELSEMDSLPTYDGWKLGEDAVEIVLAIEKWRFDRATLEQGRWVRGPYPASLDELVPSRLDRVPFEHVSGQTLKYRRSADGMGCVLYSVGLDGVDNGGVLVNKRLGRGPFSSLAPPNGTPGTDFVIFAIGSAKNE